MTSTLENKQTNNYKQTKNKQKKRTKESEKDSASEKKEMCVGGYISGKSDWPETR